MAATVTLTGVIGPGNALTAKVFTNVLAFRIDTTDSVISMEFDGGVITEVNVTAATTVTSTKSGNTWTLVIS